MDDPAFVQSYVPRGIETPTEHLSVLEMTLNAAAEQKRSTEKQQA
jgi:hypothetical protein